MHVYDGVLTDAKARGPKGEHFEDLYIMGGLSDDRSPYELINDRAECAHSTGHAKKSRNLLTRESEDPGGRNFPNAGRRFAERSPQGMASSSKGAWGHIVAARRKPYGVRWSRDARPAF